MKEIDITYGEYAAKWGLTDLYPESEDKLRQALLSGEDFDTGWWGCKKEIRYCRITQEIGMITVEVSAHMDDLWESDDLIYDALWETTKQEDELPEEIIDSIRDDAQIVLAKTAALDAYLAYLSLIRTGKREPCRLSPGTV